MRRSWILFVVATMAIACLSCSSAGVTLDNPRHTSQSAFGTSWNAHCAACNFTDNMAVNMNTTLGSMYQGSDFINDIRAMDLLISADLNEPSGLAGASQEALYIYYDNSGDDIE